ncbi:MAG TPA: phage tail tape measure protein [Kaistia sp.]|nr:phage tail tape measure protein [Kaistia sp.]
MAGKQLKVSVLVDLIDRLSSPLNRVVGRIGGLGRQVGVLGAAMAAFSFAQPIAQAAQWDSSLRNIGITAGLSGAALDRMIRSSGGQYERLALQVGQSSADIAAGANTLIAAGMDTKRIDNLLPIIGRVSTAADAAFQDISKTAFALSDGLQVPADQMEGALASLVVAGKAGRFELADMAKFFPALTAQMANLGVTGREAVTTLAAGLQIAMKGAADPAEAANNMKNFLAKLSSPEVKRNFEKMGVDLSGVMKDAVAKGINPIEAVIQKVSKLTGVSAADISKAFATAKKSGLTDAAALAKVEEQVRKIGGADKLANLFGDQQALSYLLPFLANMQEYTQIAQEAGKATSAATDTDFASRMAGLEKRLQRFSEIATQFGRRVGFAFAENLGWISAGLDGLLSVIAVLDAALPGSVDTILMLAGGFMALVIGLGLLAPALSIVGAGLGVIGAIVGVIFSPFILIIAAIAGAAAIIMADWAYFAPFFQRLWLGIKQTFRQALDALKSLFRGDFAGFKRGMLAAWESLKASASAGWDIVKGVFFKLIERMKGIDWWSVGKAIITAIWSGLSYVGSLPGRALFALGRAFLDYDWMAIGKDLMLHILAGLMWIADVGARFGRWLGDQIMSVDWAGIGKSIMQAIWDGMKSLGGAIADWFAQTFKFTPQFAPRTGGAGQPTADPTSFSPGGAEPLGGTGGGGQPLGGTNGLKRAASNTTVDGHIVVTADKGSQARVVKQPKGRVALVADRGLVLGRA